MSSTLTVAFHTKAPSVDLQAVHFLPPLPHSVPSVSTVHPSKRRSKSVCLRWGGLFGGIPEEEAQEWILEAPSELFGGKWRSCRGVECRPHCVSQSPGLGRGTLSPVNLGSTPADSWCTSSHVRL